MSAQSRFYPKTRMTKFSLFVVLLFLHMIHLSRSQCSQRPTSSKQRRYCWFP